MANKKGWTQGSFALAKARAKKKKRAKRTWTASEMGRKGGKKGGKARQKLLTAAGRTALGLKGSDSRWHKKRRPPRKKKRP